MFYKTTISTISKSMLVASLLLNPTPKVMSQTVGKQPVEENVSAQCQTLKAFLQTDDWYQKLDNPILVTEKSVKQTQALYEDAYSCLLQLGVGSTLSKKNSHLESRDRLFYFIKKETKSFIISAGTYPNSTLKEDTRLDDLGIVHALKVRPDLVDLSITDDPGIVKLRENVDIPAPKGFIYMKYYSKDDIPYLPKEIKSVFSENTNIQGFTVGRYIAILLEPEKGNLRLKMKPVIDRTVSHELIHAYINAVVAASGKPGDLPLWFREGCAIYFSNSNKEESFNVISGRDVQTIYIGSVEEYRKHELRFRYLEKKIGKEGFYNLVRQTVKENNINAIYSGVGINSEEEFMTRVEDWNKTNQMKFAFFFVVFASAFVWLVMSLAKGRLIIPQMPKRSDRYDHHFN